MQGLAKILLPRLFHLPLGVLKSHRPNINYRAAERRRFIFEDIGGRENRRFVVVDRECT